MWTRKALKSKAWEMLRTSYWKAFLVSILIAIAGGSGIPSFNYHVNMANNNRLFTAPGSDTFWPIFIVILVIVFIIVLIIAIAFRIFLGYALEVGGRRYFIQSAQNNVDLNSLGYSFEKTRYLDILKAMLMRVRLTNNLQKPC